MTPGTPESGSVGVLTTDRGLVVTAWDPWLEEATGTPRERVLGRRLDELYPELAERGIVARMERVLRQGTFEVLAPAFHKYLIPCPPRTHSEHFERMRQFVTIAPIGGGTVVAGLMITIEDVTPRLEHERDLLLQLHEGNEGERLHAVKALAQRDAEPTLLAEGMKDASWRVRQAAAEGMAASGSAKTTGALVEALREHHHDPSVLSAALTAIATSHEDLVGTLLSMLDTDDADLRTYVALALGLVGDTRGVSSLLDLLKDENQNVRYHAIEALGRIGDRSAAESLARIAEARDFFLSFAAIDALAAIGEPSVAQRLLPLLDDPVLAAPAATCLGAIGNEDVVGPLAQVLERPDAPVPEVCSALSTLHARVDRATGEGRIVADITRGVLSPAAVAAVSALLDVPGDADLAPVALVLGWIPGRALTERLAGLLPRDDVRPLVAEILATRGTEALEPLIAKARDVDSEGRKVIAQAVGRIGAPAGVPFLVSLLQDDAGVAMAAAGALGAIGDRSAFEPLLGVLDHPNDAVRRAVVGALNSIGHPGMASAMMSLLRDGSQRARESAARIIGYFGYDGAAEALVAASRDADEGVRRAVVEHLTNFDDPRALAAAIAALAADPDASVRAAAARALAQVRDAQVGAALLAACEDEDAWVRYYALRSIARRGDRSDALLERMQTLARNDPAPQVRIAAVDALGMLASPAVLPTLLESTHDPEAEVAESALRALGRFSVAATRDALLPELTSHDLNRQRAAMQAVAQQGSDEWVVALRALGQSRQQSVARLAVDALRAIGSRSAVVTLVQLADSMQLRPHILSALATLDADQVDALGDALAYENEGVRCMVVEALGRMKHPAVTSLLVSALDDPSSAVRLAAAQALGRLDLRGAKGRLTRLLTDDENAAVRRAARYALGRD